MTKNTRTSVGSTWRYSAMPPQTPPMTLFVVLRSRRVGICVIPSLAKLVEDRDAERREQAERHHRLRRDLRDRGEDRGRRDDTLQREHDGAVRDLRAGTERDRPDPLSARTVAGGA